ncbi:MAG: hypothetical protein E7Z92_06080 [Cyanobacteria bacterium SIG31]|nr:hypothetical protein [Cyanobacteria bacterium SIG31]
MSFISILSEPAILIITAFFVFFLATVIRNYKKTENRLKSVYEFLVSLNKKEISYRFQQLDEFMRENSYTNTCWEDFKKALIFPEKLYTASQQTKSGSNYTPEIYLTVDSSFFFNEDSLVHSKINYKFIQAMPTLLTGLGPFFTFLKMAIAFTEVDLSSNATGNSLNGLVANIQVAALCSVFAVGYSLLFMFFEKILYNRKCKKYYLLIQKELIRLFDVCTSEQFLLDLVKESKIQGVTNEKILKSLPDDFAKAVSKSIGEITTPYLENILYSLNKLNESMDKNSGGDVVDKLF